MSDLYGIAKSGLKAYQESLATTGQNIANVGNENYARREVGLSEMRSGNADVLQLSDNSSFGVKVDGIVRSFDQFVDMRLQDATSNFEFSKSQTLVLSELEKIIRPDQGSVATKINEFFSALNTVAQDASDLAARNVAVDAANSVAYAIKNAAEGIISLRENVNEQIKENVSEINDILGQLAIIQKEFLGNASARNLPLGLLDQRDAAINKLSKLIDIDVTYNSGGSVEIRSGINGQGQSLLSGVEVMKVTTQMLDGAISIYIHPETDKNLSKLQVQSGALAGNLVANLMLNETKDALDLFTGDLVKEINEVHASGVDLDGEVGKDLFSLASFAVVKSAAPQSTSQLSVSGDGEKFIDQTLKLKFSAADQQWTLHSSDGVLLDQFSGATDVEGLRLHISGEPALDDEFSIVFSRSKSENIQTNILDGKEIAASSLYLVQSNPTNSSGVEISVSKFETEVPDTTKDLTDLFIANRTSSEPIQFRTNGALGSLKSVNSLENFAALQIQNKVQFGKSVLSIGATTQLSFTFSDNVVETFTLGSLAENITDFSQLAEYLNKGAISSGSSKTFSELGLRAGGSNSTLVVSSAGSDLNGAYPTMIAGALDGAQGIYTEGQTTEPDIQIFTREGVQLAGKPLTNEQAAQLVRPENGFSWDATYTAEHLAIGERNTYLAAEITRKTTSGNYVASISALGVESSANPNLTHGNKNAYPVARAGMTEALTVDLAGAEIVSFQPKPGMMAGQIAERLSENLSEHGIVASANNSVELFEIPDETIGFQLKGNNAEPISISSLVVNGDTTNLVFEINKVSEETGIRALRTNSGSLLLSHVEGNDISLNDVQVSNARTFKVRQVNAVGEDISSEITLSSNEFFISGGQIELESTSQFTLNYSNEQPLVSSTSEFRDGFISKQYFAEENQSLFKFEGLQLSDSGSTSVSGLNPVAASSFYQFSVESETGQNLIGEAKGLNSENLSAENIAKSIVTELRNLAPKSSFTGNSFNFDDGFPQSGTSLEFRLGEQNYSAVLTNVPEYTLDGSNLLIDGMSYSKSDGLKRLVADSQFEITGPEPYRIEVGFKEENNLFRLYAVAKDGVLSGHALRLSSNNSVEQLAAFHTDDGIQGNTKAVIIGNEFDPNPVNTNDIARLVVNGVETRINFVDGNIQHDPNLPVGITIDIFANGGNGNLRVSIDQSLNDADIRLKATAQSAPFGIKTAATQATLSDEGFYLSQYRDNRLSSSAQVNSLAHEVLSIDGMNGEDLIVLSSGTGKASLIGAVDTYQGSKPSREIVARVSDEDQRLVRLYDKESGDYIANRSISTNDNFIFNDFDWSFNGEPNSGDEFELLVSTDRKDDASNIVQLMALADYSEAKSKGGYSSRYNDLIIDVGFKSKSSEESLKTASTMYDVAVDRKATFSGVDLDTEAARLIEQQQAYQALAKVLGTAKELVDTLLRSM